MPLGFSFTTEGPLFDSAAVQRTRTAIRKGIERVALDAQGVAQKELYPGHGKVSGRLQRAIVGRATSDLEGIVAPDDGSGDEVIYAAWIEGTGSRNATSRFKGYHYMQLAQTYVEGLDADPVIGPLIVEALS